MSIAREGKRIVEKNKKKGKIVSQNIQLDLHCISYFKYCMTNQEDIPIAIIDS